MAKRFVQAGATDQTVDVFIPDSSSTTGAGLIGLVYNSAGLVCYYRKGATGAVTQLNLATQTATGVHSDGGFVAVDGTNMPGVYRLDLSDTMIAGTPNVVVMLRGASNMVPTPLEIEVVGFNPLDATRLGLTALPNAAAEASGGLITRGTGTGQLNVSGGLAPANIKKVADVDISYYNGTCQDGDDDPPRAQLAPGYNGNPVGLWYKFVFQDGFEDTQQVISFDNVDKWATLGRSWQVGHVPTSTTVYSLVTAGHLMSEQAAASGAAAGAAVTDAHGPGAYDFSLSASEIRSAIGLALANLDTQLAALVALLPEVFLTGSVTTGATTTSIPATGSSLSTSNDVYNEMLLIPTSGTYKGVPRQITDYVGSPKTFTVEAFPGALADGTTFVVAAKVE